MSGTDDLAVLVVDDDFMVARIHTQFVERTEGFVVVGVASSGQAALDDIARLRPDLVLLDVHLPDMTGIDVLRRLRGGGDDVGVLMVTAAREADTVRAAASGGAVALPRQAVRLRGPARPAGDVPRRAARALRIGRARARTTSTRCSAPPRRPRRRR